MALLANFCLEIPLDQVCICLQIGVLASVHYFFELNKQTMLIMFSVKSVLLV